MSLLVEEDFSGYGSSAAILQGLNGGTGFTTAWSMTPTTGTAGAQGIGSTFSPGMSYTGLVSSGLCGQFWIDSNGSTSFTASRSFTGAVPFTANQTIWIAMLVGSGNGKTATTLKLNGLTTDSAGTTNATLLNFTAAAPSVCSFNTTQLYTGQSSGTFTTHLVIFKVPQGATSTTAMTVTCYVDPTLANDPSTWTAKQTQTLYMKNGISQFLWSVGGGASTGTGVPYATIDAFRIATSSYEATGNAVPSVNNNSNFFFMMA